jgi:CBS domain-containing protein
MQVRAIMTSPAIAVTAETRIRDVARIMREHQISGVPVIDQEGGLLGIVTELDLIARNAPLHEPHYIPVLSALIPVGVEEYRQYKEQLRQVLAVNAGELMSADVPTAEPAMEIEEALELMLDPECTMLPVVEHNRVIGVVTRTDMVRLIEELEMAPEDDSP